MSRHARLIVIIKMRRFVEVEINFVEDWRKMILKLLKEGGYEPDEDKSVDDIAYQYFNLRRREIYPSVRNVHRAGDLYCPKEFQGTLENIEFSFSKGGNVNRYLSRRLKSLEFNDPLLNDWGIHHFHLGETIESDGFVERTGPLLFARVTNDDVYLIGVFPYGSWVNKQLVEILHKEWPETIGIYRFDEDLIITRKVSEELHGRLRKAGASVLIELEDGAVYFSLGGGYATDGSSVDAVRHSDQAIEFLEKIEVYARENLEELIETARSHNIEITSPVKLSLELEGNKVFIREESKKIRFQMHNYQ